MDCLSEIQLELFVLNERLSKQKFGLEVREHLEECAFCKRRIEHIDGFYREVENNLQKPTSPIENNLVQSLSRKLSKWIHIARPLPLLGRKRLSVSSPVVLAAASTDTGVSLPFANLGVLTTEDREILVRLIKTMKNGEVTLHLISDNEQNYKNVLVTIPDVEGEFFSDENGKVHLGKVELPESDYLIVKVQTPCATFNLTSLDIWTTEEIAQTEVVLTNERNDSIKIEFIPTDIDYMLKVHLLKIPSAGEENRLRVMVTRGTKDPFVKRVEKGVAVFQRLRRNGELNIKVFD